MLEGDDAGGLVVGYLPSFFVPTPPGHLHSLCVPTPRNLPIFLKC